MKKIIYSENAPKPIGPYSQAVQFNNMLFISGQIPINPATGKVDSTDIAEQTKQVMENCKAVLAAAGMDFNNVIKTSIFIMDMNNFATINQVYGSYFTKDFPARETVQVAKLPLGVDVEISMIAAKE